MSPLFSCVMAVKGARPYMDEALKSLRDQGMGDDLEIIVQDGDVEPDRGQSDAFNRGFAKARGEWLFWLNADDVLLPGALRKVRDEVKVRGEGEQWIAANEIFIDANGNRVGCSVGCGWHDFLFRHAVPHVNGPSAFFRRELFERVGGFDASLNFCMDWDIWIRFMRAGAKYVRIDDFLWAQRRWAGSKTQRKMPKEELEKQWDEVYWMLKKNSFELTRGGVWLMRTWRMLSGCYMREWFSRLPQSAVRRAAIMIMHCAPYRDPVLKALAEKCSAEVYSVYANDRGHAWAGFAHNVPTLSGRGLFGRLLKRFVFSRRYSIVVWPAYHPWWLTLPIMLSAILGKRYAMTSDTKDENGGILSRSIKRCLYRHAAFIWVPGTAARRFLTDGYQVCDKRIVEGLFLVDPAVVTAETRRRPSARKAFLMVANDIPGRRIDVLVEGFRRSRREDETLTVVGAGCGKYAGEGVVGEEGVAWSDLMRMYDAADAYVHNGMEQYSTAVQIAALRGMPIICSGDVGIVADFKEPERDMLIVRDWRSAEAWKEAFCRLRVMDEKELGTMCERVRQDSVKLYDVNRVASNVSGLILAEKDRVVGIMKDLFSA